MLISRLSNYIFSIFRLCNPVVPIIKKYLVLLARVRTQGTPHLILGTKKGIISTTKEIRNKCLKGGF